MDINSNPYSEMILDESAGILVANIAYRIWREGYEVARAILASGVDNHDSNQ